MFTPSHLIYCCYLVTKSCLTLCDPMDCSPPGSSVHRISQAIEYWSGLLFPFPGDLPDPKIEPRISCIDRQILYHGGTREAVLQLSYSSVAIVNGIT